MVDKNKLIVYGAEDPQSEIIKMMLDDSKISYLFIDVYNDDEAKNHLINKANNFSIPKIEYGGRIFDYSSQVMENIFKDFS